VFAIQVVGIIGGGQQRIEGGIPVLIVTAVEDAAQVAARCWNTLAMP
jgi:hypothetical protein